MTEFIAMNNLILAVTATIPAVVFSTALLTVLAYWFLIGRHADRSTPEQDADALRIMQDIRIGLHLRNRRESTTTNEEIAQ